MVILMILFCFAGKFFVYDQSTDSNTMLLPIANKKPAFKCGILKLHFTDDHTEIIPVSRFNVTEGEIQYKIYSDPGDVSNDQRSQDRMLLISYEYSMHTFLFGTDRFGRDVMSRMVTGGQYTIIIGLLSVLISLIIGVTIGALAGYFGGFIDQLLSWFMNVIWALPTLLVVIALNLAIGKGFWQVFIAIGLTMWVDVARIVRGQVMSLKNAEFVTAARVFGFNDFRILFRHILPNCLSALIVITASNFAAAILLESGLSFLGFGIQPPTPSWGMMIKEHYPFLILHIPHLALIPGGAIALLVLGVNLAGIGLRDVLDVRA